MKVVCPCGKSFERQPQRGRPAIWCPECREIPMAQRVARPVTLDEDGEQVEEHRVSRYGPEDALGYNEREEIENGMHVLNLRYRDEIVPNKAKLFPGTPVEQSAACGQWLHAETIKLYEATAPNWWQSARSKR